MLDTTPTAVAAPPTAQEALEALKRVREVYDECRSEYDFTPLQKHFDALSSVTAFIESAAAEADAWAKLEAWRGADPNRDAYVAPVLKAGWVVMVDDGEPHLFADVDRLKAVQEAAAWCAKDGA